MRKTITLLTILLLVVFMVGCENSINPIEPQTQNSNEGMSLAKGKPVKVDCTTIPSGEIFASNGDVITTGYDNFGYNYQAHMYQGFYGNYQRPAEPVDWGSRLIMKWNDGWLSKTDCDGDGLLDRHPGFPTYIGSGAWLTNHQAGEYINADGKKCKWTYFVKIIAVPEGAVDSDPAGNSGVWTLDGIEIGPEIWGQFAIIQEVENDPCAGIHGLQYASPDHVGFGGW